MIQPQQISKLVDFGQRHHPINLYVTLGHHSEIVVDQFHQKKKKIKQEVQSYRSFLKIMSDLREKEIEVASWDSRFVQLLARLLGVKFL